jgi:hypothetical protein
MLSILAAAVVFFIFGSLWFTVLFGRMWGELNGFFKPGEQMKGSMKGMAKELAANFLLNVITASAVYYLFPQVALSLGTFLKAVLIVWLGFGFTIYANQALWERKPWKLVALNSAYGIISSVLVAAVVYYMH